MEMQELRILDKRHIYNKIITMSNILQLDKQLHHIPYNSSTTAFYQFVTESNTNQNKLYQ